MDLNILIEPEQTNTTLLEPEIMFSQTSILLHFIMSLIENFFHDHLTNVCYLVTLQVSRNDWSLLCTSFDATHNFPSTFQEQTSHYD